MSGNGEEGDDGDGGGDSATLGRDDLCHYGSALDPRHRWLVGEHAPGDEGDER